MMENFFHILQSPSIGASSSSDHFGSTSPFKVQVNFYIPIFERHIDVDALVIRDVFIVTYKELY